ncbi:O-antigen polymerase [Clostridium sp. DL-VIII]|uniref:O-antigen ligase family protein n=1 Tax=Clostridium sp. DL-VIII TaxID=641107 RepID=UPI00023B0665|nr:O-antigen ligase family protein [Clostridium sp. DL-VIII]EHJ02065.1 O-antigen polymerase [Clostridium sp. DL-VIII]
MTRENVMRSILLLIIFVISGFLGIASGNYLIAGMYILTVLIAVILVVRDTDLYNVLYGVLLVSAFYDYSLYVPGRENVYMFHIVLGIFTLVSLYKAFKDREVFINIDKKILAIYAIWFIYACISILWALNRSLSIKYIAIYLMMFAFIVDMMIYNINKERINKTINLLLLLISLVVIIGSVEVLVGQQLPIKHYYDSFKDSLAPISLNTIKAWPIVFSFNTNNLAAAIAVLLPICFYGIYKIDNIAVKIWLALVSWAGITIVTITTSRTGIFAVTFGLIVYVIYSIFNIKKLGIGKMIFPIILIVGLVISYRYSYMLVKIQPVNDKQIENFNGLSGKLHSLEALDIEEGGAGSINVRGTIIKDVLRGVLQDKKFLGYGVGNVEQFIRNQGNTETVYSPHCYPIEILGDFGLPGIVLYGVYYLYLLISNLIIGIKKRSIMCFAAVAGLIAFAPASFGPSSITYVFSYWILIGFSVACIQVYRRENNGYRSANSIKEYKII